LEFRIIFMDVAPAELWFKRGWEINAHSFATHGEAHAEMERWKLTLGKKDALNQPPADNQAYSGVSSNPPPGDFIFA
jgi:hypothetical protein